jgi:hypothetical protein
MYSPLGCLPEDWLIAGRTGLKVYLSKTSPKKQKIKFAVNSFRQAWQAARQACYWNYHST